MSVLGFFKSKKKDIPMPRRGLDVPPAPPTAEELPELPPPAEIHKLEVRKAIEKPVFEPKSSVIQRIEEEAIAEQEDILEQHGLEFRKPFFMPIDTFRELMEEIHLANNSLKENDDILLRVSEFGEDQNKEFVKWENHLSDMQKKMIYIDKTLFG